MSGSHGAASLRGWAGLTSLPSQEDHEEQAWIQTQIWLDTLT